MKKVLLMLMVALFSYNVNAQTALEEQKFLDNTYIGATAGISTPLSFNSMFPINPEFGLKLGKDFTPVYSLEVEGLTFLGSNSNSGHFDYDHMAFRAINIGLNGKINLHSLLYGYKNRVFSLSTVTGLGWFHTFNDDSKDYNGLSGKTGLNANINFGKGHSIFAEPFILWNLNENGQRNVKFNKNNAQLALNVGYVYHFKTSNGTHSFKKYDIGKLNAEIEYLKARLSEKPNTEYIKVEKVVNNYVKDEYIVLFAQNSYELTDTEMLNSIPIGSEVEVVGTASPEGEIEHNMILSAQRADAVSKYLIDRGINVISSKGLGVVDETSNRIAIIRVR